MTILAQGVGTLNSGVSTVMQERPSLVIGLLTVLLGAVLASMTKCS